MNKLARKTVFLAAVGVLALSAGVAAQETIPQLERQLAAASPSEKLPLLLRLAEEYASSDPAKGLAYGHQALELAESAANENAQADALLQIAVNHYRRSEYGQSLGFHLRALRLREKIGVPADIGDSLHLIGNVYNFLSDYDQALHYYLRALRLREEIGDSKGASRSLQNIGTVYFKLDDYEKALDILHRSLKLKESIDDRNGQANALQSIGIVYKNLEQYDKALEYYQRSFRMFETMEDTLGLAIAANNLGNLYKEQGDFARAGEYYGKSLEYSRQLNNRWGLANTLNNLGDLRLRQADHAAAEERFRAALALAEEIQSQSLLEETYHHLAELAAARRNFVAAYDWYKKYAETRDRIFNEESDKRIAEMQTRYETEKKEKEIALLNKEKDFHLLELERHKTVTNLLILCSLLILVALALLYFRYRTRKRMSRLLGEKNTQLQDLVSKLRASENHLRELVNTKDKFFSIIAHDLRGPISTFAQALRELNKHYDEFTPAEIQDYLSELGAQSRNLHNLLENLLHWSQSQTRRLDYRPEPLGIAEMVGQSVGLLRSHAARKGIRAEFSGDPGLKVYADRNMLAVVLQNLLSNAIKFSPAGGRVRIDSTATNGQVEVAVVDGGVGISPDDLPKLFRLDVHFTRPGTAREKGSGLGLILCKELVEKNGGTIWVESTPGEGSAFRFTLPRPGADPPPAESSSPEPVH
jgi:signal transduction histidine kinase